MLVKLICVANLNRTGIILFKSQLLMAYDIDIVEHNNRTVLKLRKKSEADGCGGERV